MNLEPKYQDKGKEYYCNLTKELDTIAGFSGRYKHYLLDVRDSFDNFFAIRVPGRTIGDIELDNRTAIVNIVIAQDFVGNGNFYPRNIRDVLSKYIGEVIECFE